MANQIRYQVGFDVQQNNLNQLKTSLQELQKLNVSDIMKINNSDVASATAAFYKIQEQAGRVGDALKQAFNTKLNTVNIETFNQSLKQSGSSIEQVYQAFRAAGSTGEAAFRSLSSSVLSTNIQLKETHNILDKMATTLANTVKWNAASAAVNGLTRSVQQAWGYVKSLDTSLNNIRIVTGKSADEMANFAVQANNAAKELGKTTTDYTNAALIYAQQGLNDKEIAERAAITLKTANVTGQSADAVSEQLTAVWNGYKVNAEEAQLYVDRLAAVAATTASDLEELSTGMSKVASAAAAMGVGEDQLAAQLSTIISVTRQAPESVGTALRTIYARISDIKAGIDEDGVTLGNYSGKMADLGFNVLDATGHLRDMGEVMEEIGGRWQDLTREQQVSLAQTMAGQRQYSNLIALFDNFEQYNKALNTAQNAAGTLQEQQDIYMESTAAHLQVLKASVEDIYDSLADTDSINGLIDGLSTAATVMANFVDSIGGGINLLESLGSIGLMVFSEQIAKGINTTITNLEISKENARQFDQALQATKDWQGIPGLDQVSQDLLKNREQLLELVKLMTPEQFSGMQTLLNDIKELGNQTAALEEKVAPLQKVIDLFSNKSLQETVGNGDIQDQISEKVQQQIEAYQNLAIQIENVQKEQLNLQNTPNLDVGIKLEEARVSAQNYIDKIRELNATGNLDQHQSEVQELEQLFNNLPNAVGDDIEATFSQFNDFFNRLKELFIQSGVDLEGSFEQVVQEWHNLELTNALEQTTQRTKQATATLETSAQRMARAFNIETFTKAAGSVASLGMAIQQVQNLGSIWRNEDLSTGEKVLQTITNLGMTIGMVIPALQNLNKAFNLLTISKLEDAAASGTAAAANAVEASALTATGAAATGAATGIKAFTAALATNPIFAAVAALAALAAILGTVAKYQEEARKASLEHSKALIDEENTIQEELESHRNLYSELEKINDQYHNGQISRGELKSAVEALIDQYNLEDDAVKRLKNSYGDLTGAVKRLREQDAKQKKESAERELREADSALVNQSKNKNKGTNYSSGVKDVLSDSGYQLQFKSSENESQEILKALTEAGFTFSKNEPQSIQNQGMKNFSQLTYSLDTNNAQEMLDLYNTIDQIVSDMDKKLDQTAKDSSSLYQGMVEWLKEMESAAKQYQTALEEVEKHSVELDALTSKNLDFTNINNAIGYLEQRQSLINQIKENFDKNDEEATKMADIYLKENFNSLYTKFSEISDYIDVLKEKFGDINEDVANTLGKLSPEQLAFIEDIKLKDISSWEDLQNILKYMETADLSNLKVVTDPDIDLEAAAAQYDLYSSLADQLSSSKKQSISKKEYETLAPEVQEFFSLMANGQYKMTGDAKEFYDTVNNLSLDGFKKNIAELESSNERLKSLQNIDFNRLSQSTATKNEDGSFSFQTGDVNQQLDFLTEMGYSLEKIIQWKAEIDDGYTTVAVLEDIAAAVGEYGNQTDKLSTYLQANQDAIYQNQLAIARSADSFKTLKQYLDEGLISEQAFTQAAIELDKELDTQNLDPEELEDYADHLQQIAKQSDKLSNELEENEDAAKIVAEGIMKMDDAVEKLADNWEDWSDILKNSSDISEEYANAMGSARETVADLLDISKDYVSEDFIKDHLDEIAKAATGSENAIDGLKASLAEDIIVRIMVENGIDEIAQTQVLSDIADLQAMIPDIEVGATIDDGDFLNKANKLIQDCGMTVDQANAAFDALGFETNFATEQKEVVQRVPKTVTKTEITGYTSGTSTDPAGQPIDWSYPILSQYSYNDGFEEPKGVIDVPAMATNGKTPIIHSLTRKAGGGFNNYSSSNKGGGSPGKSSGGNSGGSRRGSGGSGRSTKPKTKTKSKKEKTEEPDNSQKELKKTLEDERDIYHDINIEIQQINRNLDRVQKQQDRLYGKKLLDNLSKQSKILEQHKQKLREKQKIQQEDLRLQQIALRNLGVTFDAYGHIANYMDILEQKQMDVNRLVQAENDLIKKYNKQTDKDSKEKIANRIEKQDQRVQKAEEEYEKLQDKIKNYDSLREDMEQLVDQIEDETQQQIQINIKKFRMNVEIHLELGQAERDWNQFRREVLEHTDVLKDTDFHRIFGDATRDYRDLISYFNVKGSKGSLETLTNQLMTTRHQIEQIDKTGNSAIYGDNKAQAMEDLQNDLKELMEQLEDVNELIDNIDEAYLDTIDDIENQFNKQIEDYEYVGDLIEHDIDLLSLLYGDKNYNAMDKYYTTLENNNLKQLDSLRKQSDFWKQQWEEAVSREDIQAAKKFEENYKEVINKLNQTVEEAARNIQSKYINAIENIFNELDKKISNGRGTDYLSMEWDLMNKNANEYLDTINSAFAIQETERQYQKALNDAKSIKNQQALKTLMDEQLGILKNKEKITQYDIDRANKLLQIEQARIALQNAQSSKTSMRLKRDSQGNYSYEYTASEGDMADAQSALAQARNDLYNFDKDRYQSNLNDMLAAWRDFQSDYKGIVEDVSLTEQQRIERLALLRQQYGGYINDKTEQNLVIRTNLTESAFNDLAFIYKTDVENYNQMSRDQQKILMEDLVPAWKSGIQEMSDTVAGAGGFIPTCEDAFKDITDATLQYEQELDKMTKIAEVDLKDVKNGVDDVALSFSSLITKNDELKTKMEEEMTAVNNLKTAAHDLGQQYESVYKNAKLAVTGISEFLRAQQQKAALEAEEEAKKLESDSNTGSSSGGGDDSGSNKPIPKESSASRSKKKKEKKKKDKNEISDKLIEGIAGNIWIYGTWGDSPDREDNLIAKFGKKKGKKIYKAVQAKFNSGYGYEEDVEHDWDYYKKYNLSNFRSGGYTGSWAGDSGKLAMLHQKQMVLNQEDTKNILDSVNIMRSVMSSLNGNMIARLGDIRTGYAQMVSNNTDGLEQNVHIDATFPNVNSKQQIEDAFSDLINIAAQRIMKR